MPSVAALYDIHGNLAALEAVLAEVPDDAAVVEPHGASAVSPIAASSRLRGSCALASAFLYEDHAEASCWFCSRHSPSRSNVRARGLM